MHPFFKNKAQLLVYLALWLPVAAVFVLLLVGQQQPWPLRDAIGYTLLLATFLAFLFLSMYYVCRGVPLRDGALGKVFIVQALAVTVATGLWLGSGLALAGLLGRSEDSGLYVNAIVRNLPALSVFSYVMLSLAIAVSYLLLALEDQRVAESNHQRMQTLAREAELRSLRAQINPHFLFNSLNSISALTTLHPDRAREMCLLLSEFFRRNIDIGNQESTTLGEELDLVFNYLQIEMARFGKRLQVHADVPDDLRAFALPPLLLQPLVENAVKHGIAGLVDGGTIAIRAKSLSGGGLSLSVENPYDPDQPTRKRRGIGLENVRGRLDYRYGREARFEVAREGEQFRAKIQIAPSAPTPNPANPSIPETSTS